MEAYGLNIQLFVFQLLSIILTIVWVALAIVALLRLRRVALSPAVRLGWVALVVLVPFLGAMAVLLLYPPQRGRQDHE